MKDKVTKSRDTVPLGKIGITTTKNRFTNLKEKCHEIYNALKKKKLQLGPIKTDKKQLNEICQKREKIRDKLVCVDYTDTVSA